MWFIARHEAAPPGQRFRGDSYVDPARSVDAVLSSAIHRPCLLQYETKGYPCVLFALYQAHERVVRSSCTFYDYAVFAVFGTKLLEFVWNPKHLRPAQRIRLRLRVQQYTSSVRTWYILSTPHD